MPKKTSPRPKKTTPKTAVAVVDAAEIKPVTPVETKTKEEDPLIAAANQIDGLLSTIRDHEATLIATNRMADDSRYQVGRLFLEVRKTIPLSGPRARHWGDFVRARGLSLDTATRYMHAAQYIQDHPGAEKLAMTEIYRLMARSPRSSAVGAEKPKKRLKDKHEPTVLELLDQARALIRSATLTDGERTEVMAVIEEIGAELRDARHDIAAEGV